MIIRLTTYGFTLGALTATLLACAADNPERLSTVDASVAADGSSPSRADATPDLVAADFGLDAVASDSGAPDASVPPSPCDDLCTRFVGCATEQCGEGAAGQAESLDGLCQTACLESPAFATVGGGIETCG
ncbi:MAG: hypothetical protein EXR76_12365, partial [Myxococcales bacterium]|nr:hypothetical protein [Myxococcales bacterium]